MSINTLISNPNILNQLANLIPQPTPISSLSIAYSSTIQQTSQSSTNPITIGSFGLDFTPSKTLFFLINVSCENSVVGYGELRVTIGGSTNLTYVIPLNTIPTNNTAFFTYIPTIVSSSSVQIELAPLSGSVISITPFDLVSVIVFEQNT